MNLRKIFVGFSDFFNGLMGIREDSQWPPIIDHKEVAKAQQIIIQQKKYEIEHNAPMVKW